MANPINVKYPLFLRDINKCDCKSDSGGSSVVGGYPIVTIEDNFNIEAKPNIFYNIKNPINQDISIFFNPLELAPTKVYFTYDNSDNDDDIFSTVGINLFPDNTKEGYNYKGIVNLNYIDGGVTGGVEVYFTNDIIQGGSTVACVEIFGQDRILSMNNINIIKTKNIINEFVFNINSPSNILFNKEIKWSNDNIPDLTKEGICTISIVNGVACYTFVNN